MQLHLEGTHNRCTSFVFFGSFYFNWFKLILLWNNYLSTLAWIIVSLDCSMYFCSQILFIDSHRGSHILPLWLVLSWGSMTSFVHSPFLGVHSCVKILVHFDELLYRRFPFLALTFLTHFLFNSVESSLDRLITIFPLLLTVIVTSILEFAI